jgi:UDP-GlcNAc:undecaprenyl-phosphate GlcNAc-1-phosphate transferase
MQIPAISAFLLAFVGYCLVLAVFPKLKLLDFPERYGLTRGRIPYPAGCVAAIVFLIVFSLTTPLGMKEFGVVLAVMLLGTISFIDDRTPLPSWLRLAVQILAALIVFVAGSRIFTLTSPFGGILKLDTFVVHAGVFGGLPVFSALFTIAWLLLTINALNWFDGVTGQVSVISTIGFLMLGCLAYFRNGETDTAEIAFVLAAIAAAGIFFDFPPGKLLLGDTGSMFFGLMLGLLGVYHGGKVATIFLALGIPLLDATFVIVRRLMKGQSPLRGGRDHLHHLLLDRGWSPRSIIGLTAVIGTTFGVIALFLNTAEKGIALIILTILVLGLTKYAHKK